MGALKRISHITGTITTGVQLNFMASVDGSTGWTQIATHTGAGAMNVSVADTTQYRYLRVDGDVPGTSNSNDVITYHWHGATSSGSYTITFAGALANSNVAEWTTASTGYSLSTPQQAYDAPAYYSIVNSGFNGAAVDGGAASNRGAVAHLHAIYASGVGKSLIVKVQHSTDNNTWADLVTFDTLTNPGSSRKLVADNTTVNRYVRAIVAGGDITGSWVIAVGLSRYNNKK
jgi:hypothetical protein